VGKEIKTINDYAGEKKVSLGESGKFRNLSPFTKLESLKAGRTWFIDEQGTHTHRERRPLKRKEKRGHTKQANDGGGLKAEKAKGNIMTCDGY